MNIHPDNRTACEFERGERMKTRKELGDREGNRSFYVIEWRSISGIWSKYYDNTRNLSNNYRDAAKIKEEIYQDCKRINKTWRRKDFRISLYARVDR